MPEFEVLAQAVISGDRDTAVRLTQEAVEVGADGYAVDATSAVDVAKVLTGG